MRQREFVLLSPPLLRKNMSQSRLVTLGGGKKGGDGKKHSMPKSGVNLEWQIITNKARKLARGENRGRCVFLLNSWEESEFMRRRRKRKPKYTRTGTKWLGRGDKKQNKNPNGCKWQGNNLCYIAQINCLQTRANVFFLVWSDDVLAEQLKSYWQFTRATVKSLISDRIHVCVWVRLFSG